MQNQSIIDSEAWLWEGRHRLPGRLQLLTDRVCFTFIQPRKDLLRMEIPLRDIADVRSFLLYGIKPCGLSITNHTGDADHFVLEDAPGFMKAVCQVLF